MMHPSGRRSALLTGLASIVLFAQLGHAGTCTTNQRKSWNDLTNDERLEYLEAELCLLNSEPSSGVNGATNRFEELQANHEDQVHFIHKVGAFLPWHRYFVTVHERLLQNECNYTGAQPYWDEIADQADFPDLAIFDTTYGFGGDGTGTNGCVTDGPFANLTLHYQSGKSNDYCLSRSLNQRSFSGGSQSAVDACLAETNFTSAWPCLENSPHNAGHGGVGGVMVNTDNSPGDPLFYMHHAYLDKVFWEWQSANLPDRLYEIGGDNVGEIQSESDAEILSYTDYNGDDGDVTTLNHTLWVGGIMPNVTISDVMDLNGDLVCAEYV